MRKIWILAAAMIVGACGLAAPAAAETIGVTGYLSTQPFGAETSNQLILNFPTFSVTLDDESPNFLTPGFCADCGNGSAVPFAQQTRTFSLHSVSGLGNIDADVSGYLSFGGPTDTLAIPDCGFLSCGQRFDENVTWSGFITVKQGGTVLFNGALSGTGSADSSYNAEGIRGTRWEGAEYHFDGASTSATPEPASMLLLGTGLAGLLAKRRARRG